MTTQESSGRCVAQGYLRLFVLLAAGIVTSGYFFHRNYAQHYRTKVEHELTTIGELKVNELVQFRRERLADAAILFKSASFAGLVRRAIDTPPDLKVQGYLREWLGEHLAPDQYDRGFLLDAQGAERMTVPAAAPLATALAPRVAETLRSGQIAFQDFYRDEQDQRIYLALLVPIHDETQAGRVLGVVGLRIDPTESLYPMINRWPVPSATAEVKLVRRDGDAALYLNELRTRKGTTLTERVPLTETKRTAVMAVLGRKGMVEGVDKPGNPVVGYVRAVPDSPWFVVLRIEAAEAYAPVREQLWLTVILVAALLAALGAGLGLIWRNQRTRYYREKAKVATALRESEERYRAVIENLGEGIGHVSSNEQFIFVNPAAADIFGVPPGGMLGRSLREFTAPDQFDRIREQTGKRRAGEKSAYEIEISRPDGEKRNLLVTAVPQFDRQGKFSGTFGVFRDITKRRLAEEALRESEAKFRVLFEASITGVVIIRDGRFDYVNPAAAQMAGYSPAELLAAPTMLDFVVEEDRPLLRENLRRRLTGESDHVVSGYRFRKKDGSLAYMEALGSRISLEGRVAIMATIMDVTERKLAEAERERLIGELRETLAEVKTLGGLLPICAGCKKIRDDTGYWSQVEVYIQQHTDAKFTHGLCPECIKKYYPDLDLP